MNKQLPILILLLLLIFLCGCSKEKRNISVDRKETLNTLLKVTAKDDSTIVVEKEGKSYSFRLNFKNSFFDWNSTEELVQDFNKFYESHKNLSNLTKRELLDVNGDGKLDTIIFNAMVSKGKCKVLHLIKSQETTIWRDSLILDLDYVGAKFASDSLVEILSPCSYWLLASFPERVDFVYDYEYGAAIKSVQHEFLKNNHNDSIFWKNELPKYKGKIVQNLFLESGYENFIWDRRKSKFVLLFGE